MPIDTLIPPSQVLVLGQQVVWGTCMLGSALGTVVSCRLRRTGDSQAITDQHSITVAMLMVNPRFELDLETVFDADVELPGLMDEITFPYLAVKGRVLNVEILWESGSERALSLRATRWDSLASAALTPIHLSSIRLADGTAGSALLANSGDPFTLNNDTPLLLNAA
jgi:hypothetical protein